MTLRFSDGFLPQGVDRDVPATAAILAECQRQYRDARETLTAAQPAAATIAASIRERRRVLLLGMGASHYANQIAAARLRLLGVDAVAQPASEALYAPLPGAWPTILTSQSGGSAEIVRWLEADDRNVIGAVTLNDESGFDRHGPVIVGSGGAEHAFAATRSFTVTLAAFAAILVELGAGVMDRLPETEPPIDTGYANAVQAFAGVDSIVVSGRASFDGMAGMTALGLCELARLPCAAFEGGQFRHGVVEMLNRNTGVVLFRSTGASANKWQAIVDICRRAESRTLVFDASGLPPLSGAMTIRFSPGDGIAALLGIAPTQQAFVLGIAAARVASVGAPAYSSKVTDSE
ncbi:MAG: aminotransferase [Pseudomonadota bacterium]